MLSEEVHYAVNDLLAMMFIYLYFFQHYVDRLKYYQVAWAR